MIRKSAKLLSGVLAILAALTILRLYYDRIAVAPVIEYTPVDMFVLLRAETDSQQNFRKLLFEDHASGYKKAVYSNTRLAGAAVEGLTLVVLSIGNTRSFGQGRSFEDYMAVISSLDYDKLQLNLAFLCGSEDLYTHLEKYFENFFLTGPRTEYGQVTLITAAFLRLRFAKSNHNHKVQRARRRLIAQARNFALFNALDNEQYTLFLDADVINFDHPDMLKRFIASGKDIVVPRIVLGSNLDYDRNSWRGARIKPLEKQLQLMDNNEWDKAAFVPMDVKGEMFHLEDHVRDLKKADPEDPRRSLDYTEELDSVGGAVLFAKSIIYKQGVVFPPIYVVGSTWDRPEGYDGIETEGLCYVAKQLGYKCWAMPNLVAQHDVH